LVFATKIGVTRHKAQGTRHKKDSSIKNQEEPSE